MLAVKTLLREPSTLRQWGVPSRPTAEIALGRERLGWMIRFRSGPLIDIVVCCIEPDGMNLYLRSIPYTAWLSPNEMESLTSPRRVDRWSGRLAGKIAGSLVADEIPLDEMQIAHDGRGAPILLSSGAAVADVSIAHSRGWGIAAAALNSPVGIDIEHERKSLAYVSLDSKRISAPDKVVASPLLSWVAAEAVAKAFRVVPPLRVSSRRPSSPGRQRFVAFTGRIVGLGEIPTVSVGFFFQRDQRAWSVVRSVEQEKGAPSRRSRASFHS